MEPITKKICSDCMGKYPEKLFPQDIEKCIYCFKKGSFEKNEGIQFLDLVKILPKHKIEEDYSFLFYKYYFIYQQFGEHIFPKT